MKKIQELLQESRLSDSISHLEIQLRDDPLNVDAKSSLIELLCINGELERADKQLNYMVQKHPDFLIGAANLRQLIHAEQSRQDFLIGKSVPHIFTESDAHIEAFMSLRVEMNQGNAESITNSALKLEENRTDIQVELNGEVVNEFRDLDDSLGGFLEIFGTDGKYYIAQIKDIEYIHFKPVSSIIEQVWRRVELSIKNGPSGEAHIPLVYANSSTDAEKLGRETDWQEKAPDVMVGVGQKMWFVNDQAVPLSDFIKLSD
ncbi:type VI secretion system accessory protein TagJ [Colwellia sp. E2M01]|uniref:type VI secretion system accessory protein TagJ n=1 Tax=Colwellia sp. E2M01 TaxID=2841561 RepID=UPI001C0A6325|nr:type VI secretion system accessory protein TagJ [Colwellia sp. E2M01]MBU2870487.1 virulence protein, SciE type [Colwellia sp. E2M01]